MRYALYSNSEHTWDAMLKSIRAARTSIYLEMYIFLSDTEPSHGFYQALAERAQAGVTVKVIIDGFGSSDVPTKDLDILRAAGTEVLVFREIFRRTHRKILIVDEKVGFLGGVNIGKAYIGWLDLHVKVSGRTIVQSLVRSFASTYKKCGGRDKQLLDRTYRSPLKNAKLWLLEHTPMAGRNPLGIHYRERFKNAQSSIVIVSPYFLPHPWLVTELERALRRGVRVEVILPEKTDPALAALGHRIFVQALAPLGANFYFTRTMLHAKALVIDSVEATVGSQNIDALSFDYNLEAGMLFTRKDMIRDLLRILDSWKKDARLFDPLTDPPRWYDSFIALGVWLLQPVL